MANVEALKDAVVSVTQLVYQTAFESNDQFREAAEKRAAEKRQEENQAARDATQSSSPDVIVDVKSTTVEAAPETPAPQTTNTVDVTA